MSAVSAEIVDGTVPEKRLSPRLLHRALLCSEALACACAATAPGRVWGTVHGR